VLCTKHPGFIEEREWRVIHAPQFEKSTRLTVAIESIGGTPQRVFKIPLQNVPEDDLSGIEIPELIDRIVVGPTKFPNEIQDAFIHLLSAAGVQNAAAKVVISNLPLRA
jgi:hypothetical protein